MKIFPITNQQKFKKFLKQPTTRNCQSYINVKLNIEYRLAPRKGISKKSNGIL